MTTTFATITFKNLTINMLTGVSASPTPIAYVNPYNGAQAPDPSTTPAGSFGFAAVSSAPNLSTHLSAAGGGISQLSTARGPTNPSVALALSAVTTARLFNSSQQGLIDVSASLEGGGGGLIYDTLNPVAAVGSVVKAFSFKLPLSNGGTLSMNAALANRLVDLWCVASTAVPEMGKNTNGQSLLKIFSGAAPASANLPETGTLLAAISIGSTNIWGSAVGGAASLVSNPSAVASATGTAGYARLVKSYGLSTFIIQGSVGTSGTDFVISATDLTAGVTNVALNEATISI